MGTPTRNQIDVAILWLRTNEGDNGESEACAAVADWLQDLERNKFLRRKAKEAGIPVAALRQRLKSTFAAA